MSNVSRGLGATIAVGATNIGTILKITTPSMKRDQIDVSVLSTTGGFKSFIAGLADGGEFAVEGFFDTADVGQQLLYTKFSTSSVDTYTILFPTLVGASWSATCFVSTLDLGTDIDTTKAIGFKMTLKITGAPVMAITPVAGLSGLTFTGTSGSMEPTFATGVHSYYWTYITDTSITCTPVGASQQYTMYIDGVSQGTLNCGSVSVAIPFAAIGSKKIELIISEAGLSPLIYTVIVVRTA